MAWRNRNRKTEAEQDEGDVWYWIEDPDEAPMALGLGRRRQDEEDRRPSMIEADRRTLESFNKRKEWDPRSEARAASGDNTDYEWFRRTRDREDPSMYDSWAQYEEEDEEEDDYQEPEPALMRRAGRSFDRLDDEDNREEALWLGGRPVQPSVRSKEWRDITFNKPEKQQKAKKDKSKKKDKKKEEVMEARTHIVCIDESADAERAFKHASRNLPQHHRLILAHGVYKGLLGSHRDDEDRLRRVKNKYLRACSDLGRECTFRQFKFSSFGHFGEEVCSLAEKVQAESVLVGRRSLSKSDPAGSASKSVLKACRVPISVIVEREQEQPMKSRRTFVF